MKVRHRDTCDDFDGQIVRTFGQENFRTTQKFGRPQQGFLLQTLAQKMSAGFVLGRRQYRLQVDKTFLVENFRPNLFFALDLFRVQRVFVDGSFDSNEINFEPELFGRVKDVSELFGASFNVFGVDNDDDDRIVRHSLEQKVTTPLEN